MDLNTLALISEKINKEKIKWAVGASVLLSFYDIIDNPNDLDILVSEDDAERLYKLLKALGEEKYKQYVEPYKTKYFHNFIVEGLSIDLMGGFIIKHSNGEYIFPFDAKAITDYKDINGVKIPLSSLEDWYILYQLIPNRESKVKLIEDYLLENGIENYNLLERALRSNLPQAIKQRTERLISMQR